MALSSNSKRGLAIGALLPVLLSAYTESRKQAETKAQRTAAHLEERQKRREALQARDLDGAAKFLAQITVDSAAPEGSPTATDFCAHVYMASELVRLSTYSTATRAAVIGGLQYTREQPASASRAVAPAAVADARPRICECPAMLGQMRSNWRPSQIGTAAPPVVIEEMTSKLDEVFSKCSVDVAATPAPTTPAPVIAPPPPPTPAPPLPSEATIVGSNANELMSDRSLLSHLAEAVIGASATRRPDPGAAVACGGEIAMPADTRVYIQIAREDQRDDAAQLQAALRALGYTAPGIERVGTGSAPSRAQLRYVYAEDCASAQRLIDVVRRLPAPMSAELLAIPQYRGRSLRRSFELWFPK